MGILRTDRVSGLGGANAIKGSVKFTSGGALDIDLDGTSIGTSNFTIEAWVFWFGNGFHQFTGSSSNNFNFYITNDDGDLKFWNGSSTYDFDASPVRPNEWTHVALVREGTSTSQTKVYVNGVNTNSITLPTSFSFDRLLSGINYLDGSTAYGNGYTSNLRVTLDAVYTSAFTPPSSELTVLDNTIVLCCQSPSNILQEATGKTIVPFKHGVNQGDAVASHFTPNSPVGFSTTTDVGTQFGSTFDGVTTFDSQAYFVPPGGNTRERNRGRGLFGGGYTTVPSGAALNTIFLVEIQSLGNSVDFGDLNKAACWGGSMCASSTRGLHAGGTTPTNLDSIDFVTIASPSNATDFGNLTSGRGYTSAASNQTRGLVGGGRGGSPVAPLDSIDLITIATLGNASDFGDLSNVRMGAGALASPTRALFIGGSNSPATPSTFYASIDRVEIATAGDASDFGDLTAGTRHYMGCASSTTRGLIGGGSINPARVNTIEFVTIASDGNSSDFGDLLDDREHPGATSNGTRAIWAGGVSPYRNSIEFVTIATTGNAQDFGDIADQTSYAYASGTSDSHGGLS